MQSRSEILNPRDTIRIDGIPFGLTGSVPAQTSPAHPLAPGIPAEMRGTIQPEHK